MGSVDYTKLMVYIIIVIISYFVAGPVIMSTIGKYTVQRRFAILMVNEGVISEADFKKYHKMQQIIGTVFSILVLSVMISMGIKNGLYGWLCVVVGFGMGCLKSRKCVTYTSFTVQQFKKVFRDMYDVKKLNAFIEKNF